VTSTPEVVYSATSVSVATKRSEPLAAMVSNVCPACTMATAPFTRAPEVVYSAITESSRTSKFDPDGAMASVAVNPEISEASTNAPDVVYSAIVEPSPTNKSDPETAMLSGIGASGSRNGEMKDALMVAPDVVYSPTVPSELKANMVDQDTATSLHPPLVIAAFTV